MPKETFFNLNENKRQKIEKAIEEEFGRTSFSETSISNIIKNAQIPRGSFYQYFEDKEDAIKYILQKYINMEKENIQKFLFQSDGDIFKASIKLYEYIICEVENSIKVKLYKNVLEEFKKSDFNSFESLCESKKFEFPKNLINIDIINIKNKEDIKYIFRILSIVTRKTCMDVITKKISKEQGLLEMKKQIEILENGMRK